MTYPTFIARFLHDGATALKCHQTGTRYIVAEHRAGPLRDECGAYREGKLIMTGPRAAAINAVESDARWQLRNGGLSA
jgi:hypothetical protein